MGGPPTAPSVTARRNLRLYRGYVAGIAFYAWMPIFFLYMSARVSLQQVLALEAIYYMAVVLLELPSGYFSDRWGRRPTLVIAASALVGSYLLFAVAASFAALAGAQLLLAMGLAFNSGTDTSFHYANLTALSQQSSYGDREARLGGMAFLISASAALLGGALGAVDLRLAYVVSAAAALAALGCALAFRSIEEPHEQGSHAAEMQEGKPRATPLGVPLAFGQSLRVCLALARTPGLGWLFAVAVAATVLNHIPYELYQPYIEQLSHSQRPIAATPLVTGAHAALVQLVAFPVARASAKLATRFGIVRHLLATLALQAALIVIMASVIHPAVAVLLLTRSVPHALQDAPLRQAIAPRVPSSHRATYLSLQSLAGRLAFAALLLGVAPLSEDGLSATASICAGVAVVGCVLLWLLRPNPPQTK